MTQTVESTRSAAAPRIALRTGRGVLVLDHHGFGNVVMSLPLLTALSRARPGGSRLHVLLASQAHHELFRENPLEFTPHYLDGRGGITSLFALQRRLAGKIDLVIGVPQVPMKIVFAVRVALGSRYAVGETESVGWPWLSHAVEKQPTKPILGAQDEMLALLGIAATGLPPALVLSEEERAWAAETLATAQIAGRPLIGLHASSEKANKRWPADRFGAVLASLRTAYPSLAVVSFGTAVELPAARQAAESVPGMAWCEGNGKWTIRQTAALLERCDLLLCGDTGLMHIAAAVGTRTVAVFGPTSPERLSPGTGLWVKPSTPCHPCYERPGYQNCQCIRTIEAGLVVDQALRVLSSLDRGTLPCE